MSTLATMATALLGRRERTSAVPLMSTETEAPQREANRTGTEFEAQVLRHTTEVTPAMTADEMIAAHDLLKAGNMDPASRIALATKLRHASLDLRCKRRLNLRGFLGETKVTNEAGRWPTATLVGVGGPMTGMRPSILLSYNLSNQRQPGAEVKWSGNPLMARFADLTGAGRNASKKHRFGESGHWEFRAEVRAKGFFPDPVITRLRSVNLLGTDAATGETGAPDFPQQIPEEGTTIAVVAMPADYTVLDTEDPAIFYLDFDRAGKLIGAWYDEPLGVFILSNKPSKA